MAIKFQYNKTSGSAIWANSSKCGRRRPYDQKQGVGAALRGQESEGRPHRSSGRSSRASGPSTTTWSRCGVSLIVTCCGIADIELTEQKIAGVRTPVLREIVYEEKPYDLFSSPVWYAAGIDLLKRLSKLGIEYELFNRKMELLDFARRKNHSEGQPLREGTDSRLRGCHTQDQTIPFEDEENLSKSAQKIVKTKQQQAGEGADVMIARMSKYDFILYAGQSDDFIERLRELGLVDVTCRGWEPSEGDRQLVTGDRRPHQGPRGAGTVPQFGHFDAAARPFASGDEAYERYGRTAQERAALRTEIGQTEKAAEGAPVGATSRPGRCSGSHGAASCCASSPRSGMRSRNRATPGTNRLPWR